MLDFACFTGDPAIPVVHPEDLGHVWQMFHSRPKSDPGTATGYAMSLIVERCGSDNPDLLAIWARSGVLELRSAHGLLPDRVRGFKPEDFLARLAENEETEATWFYLDGEP